METIISTKSRNLGIGWSDKPFSDSLYPDSSPEAPIYVGGLRSIEQGLDEMAQLNTDGAYHNAALFVGDKRVMAVWDVMPDQDIEDEEAYDGFKEVWVKMNINEMVSRLRKGEMLKVKLKD